MEKTKVDKFKEMMKGKKESSVVSRQSLVTPTTDDQRPTTSEQRPSEDQLNVDEMAVQIKAAEDEAKAHYDKLLRVMAEFENFKKRMERERLEHAKFSSQSIICDILLVLDDLDRVLEHIPAEATSEVSAIADGIKLIQNHLMSALSKHGLSCVESSVGNLFDPAVHEAVSYIESDKVPANSVVAEHRKGWMLHDRLIRAASVTVAKGKDEVGGKRHEV